MRNPTGFWKFSRLGRLKVCAKIIFSVPVSSAGIERLYNEAGMVLTKDKSIAAVNTAVHRSKLTIAVVNQNSTVTWLALRRRGRGRGLQ